MVPALPRAPRRTRHPRPRQVIGQLGNVAYERFNDARGRRGTNEQLLRHLNDAADAYHQKLGLLPDNAVASHAVTHHALGNVYGQTDDSATALGHFQRAIQYYERQDDRYGAGWARHDAASTLANAGRQHDALLYARAALRDYDAVGPGAAAAPARPASSSPSSNRNQPMITNPIPATPHDPVLPCLRTGQDTWAAVAGRARCLPAGGVDV